MKKKIEVVLMTIWVAACITCIMSVILHGGDDNISGPALSIVGIGLLIKVFCIAILGM